MLLFCTGEYIWFFVKGRGDEEVYQGIKDKKDKTEEDEVMIKMISLSYDISDIKYIEPVLECLSEGIRCEMNLCYVCYRPDSSCFSIT